MAEAKKPSTPGAPASQGAAPAVPGNAVPKSPAATPVTPSAQQTASKHGGLAGGRKREDGLVPGSPEALEADKKRDAQRKRDARAAERKPDPPPIPSATGPAQAPVPGQPAVPGVAPAPIPWDPKMLEPLTTEVVGLTETGMVKQIAGKAVKARLPGEIVHDFEKDAHWNPAAKKIIEISLPKVAAKWLNRTGVSAEHQDEVGLGFALLAIVGSHTMLLKRMDELIKKANPPIEQKPAAAKPEEKKP